MKKNDWGSTQLWFSTAVLGASVYLAVKGVVDGNQFTWLAILSGVLYGGRRITQAIVDAVKAKAGIATTIATP